MPRIGGNFYELEDASQFCLDCPLKAKGIESFVQDLELLFLGLIDVSGGEDAGIRGRGRRVLFAVLGAGAGFFGKFQRGAEMVL